MFAILLALAAPIAPADLVIENARIWSDGLPGFAEFAAVSNGRFVYVGKPDGEYVGPSTRRIDAKERIVLPGLIDAHIHLVSGGLSLTELNLREAKDKEGFIRLVREWAAGLPEGRWVRGGRWSTESWATVEQPTKAWVDPVTGNRPLFLSRMDGHSALVNSAALKLARITKEGPPDPEGGVIDRDPKTGEPTGILRESAMGLVARFIPGPSRSERLQGLKSAMEHANASGITAVCEIGGVSDFELFEELAGAHELTVRFFLYPTISNLLDSADPINRFQGKPGWAELRGFKAYMDGSLGSRTAFMREPFLNNEPNRKDWHGLLREGVTDGSFAENLNIAKQIGFQPIAHAIGDEANHVLLAQLSEAFGANLRMVRARSEHAQHLLPEDIARFAALGVIASMQPLHKADDGRYAESYIGEKRSRSSYAYKSLLDAGAVVAFGSDWPVVSLNPFLGVEAAVTGRTLDGKLWHTQQNITVGEALRCYTSRAAYAAFAEDQIGKIAPGFRADFVILNESPFGPAPKWDQIRPTEVWVEGKQVFPK
jgi:predicted amidohydrolase YtcJ